jgi:hypothetical protein
VRDVVVAQPVDVAHERGDGDGPQGVAVQFDSTVLAACGRPPDPRRSAAGDPV